MALTAAERATIIQRFQRDPRDTGSPEVQIALLTANIKKLTEHFKVFKKDLHSLRGLKMQVEKRRSLLKYLRRVDSERFKKLINELNLRDSETR